MSALSHLAGRKISVVAGICVRHDAISAAALANYRCLDALSPGNVRLFAHAVEFPEVRHAVKGTLTDLLLDPHFLDSHVVVYHFGVYYGLFDAIVVGNGKARQYVRYHNITPKHLASESDWPTIDRSLAQLEHLHHAHHVWCDSDFNRQCLLDIGLEPSRLSTLALPVPTGRAVRQARSDREGPVRLVFVGRLVHSKGVLDLVGALGQVARRSRAPFRVFLVGNASFADADHVRCVRERIAAEGLADRIHFCGGIDDREKHALLNRADILAIPSYHEGFCVPVVEAFAAGCFVVGYDAGNLPAIANGLGRLAPAGDVASLASHLGNAIDEFARARSTAREPMLECADGPLPLSAFRAKAREYAEGFGFDRYRERLLSSLEALEKENVK